MIVVDTSVWIDYFNGVASPHADLLDQLLSRERLVIGDIILMEVLQGFRRDADFRQAQALLDTLEFHPMLGREIALLSAKNYRKLRRAGVTVRKTIDVMIGSFCVQNRHRLLHADRDFDPIEKHLGLSVLRP
ncbi:MAG: type II toxin-antitoxin system VapC family toxin [Acidiferrobacteraceae bacterium]